MKTKRAKALWKLLVISSLIAGGAEGLAWAVDEGVVKNPNIGIADTDPQVHTDEEIAAVATTADQVDIDLSRVGRRSSNTKVRQLCDHMIADHSLSKKEAIALVKRLGITPKESDVSRRMKADGDSKRKSISRMHGAEFDRALMAEQVKFHEKVLASMDGHLIQNASNADLKRFLEKTRPVIAEHLEHAKQVQTSLGQSDL